MSSIVIVLFLTAIVIGVFFWVKQTIGNGSSVDPCLKNTVQMGIWESTADSNGKVILCFDTETTGIKAHSRIAQLSWLLFDSEQGKLLSSESFYIQPEGWTMPPDAARINGLNTSMLKLRGIPIADALTRFCEDVGKCEVVVCHNAPFDMKRILYENTVCNGNAVEALKDKVIFDTMTQNGKFNDKVKLSTLFEVLFETGMYGSHNALYDAKATLSCALKLWGYDEVAETLAQQQVGKHFEKCLTSQLYGKTVCFSGEFPFSIEEAEWYLSEKFSAAISPRMSKKVDYLIVGFGGGETKRNKAKELGTPIIPKSELNKFDFDIAEI